MHGSIRRFVVAPLALALVLGTAGTAAAASGLGSVTASPKSINFGKVPVATYSDPQTFWIVNDTKAALIITSIQNAGGEFEWGGGTFADCLSYIANGTVLYPGQTCGTIVAFHPSATGRQTGSVNFTFTDGARTWSWTEKLVGTGS